MLLGISWQMDEIFLKIRDLSLPYYQKGRVYDIDQVNWMMWEADKVADLESLNKKLLVPLVILHDVGYSAVGKDNPHIKDKNAKVIHMREGAKIARKILEQVNYPQELIEKITYYISVHDQWLFGNDQPYQECREMAVFNDLDFLWVNSTFEAFKITGKSMNMTPKEFYDFWIKDEKLTRRPFCCDYTKNFWETSIQGIKKILDSQ